MTIVSNETTQPSLDTRRISALLSPSQLVYSELSSPCFVRKDQKPILFAPWQMDGAETPGASVSIKARKHSLPDSRTSKGKGRPLPARWVFKASSTEEIKDWTWERMSACSLDLSDGTGRKLKLLSSAASPLITRLTLAVVKPFIQSLHCEHRMSPSGAWYQPQVRARLKPTRTEKCVLCDWSRQSQNSQLVTYNHMAVTEVT